MLTGKWSLPHKSVVVETLASRPKSREEIVRSILEEDDPEEEKKVAAPSFSKMSW